MKSGVDLKEFERLVLEIFGFLLTEEQFETYNSEATQYVLRVDFIRHYMLIRVEYSFKNDTIEVFIFRNPETVPAIPMNYNETSGLGLMLTYSGHPFADFDKMMPYNVGGIETSLKLLANAFHKYALDTIHGKEWISVNMVRSGERRREDK